MHFLYNLFILISEKVLLLFGNFFGKKVEQFRRGQFEVFKKLEHCINHSNPVIWMHVSSLGEYEQGLPILEKLRIAYPNHQLILTFFSPSGYEVKKDTTPVDCVVYLPVDTPKNAREFLEVLQPEMVFFVKYDFWPNYLFQLKKMGVKTYLISGLFSENHIFFRSYNAWLKKSLFAFTHFFVQDEHSKIVLKNNGFDNVVLAGDTRFDRVFHIADQAEPLDFILKFKQDKPLIIIGSSWPEDEKLWANYIDKTQHKVKFLVAPHQIDKNHIQAIKKSIHKPVAVFTEINQETEYDKDILILDTIGMLNKAYRYANIVYVGNGFGKSIHNIQEPAIYGVPIITGPHIQKFKEAVDLAALGGLVVVRDQKSLDQIVDNLLLNPKLAEEKSAITKQYSLRNLGASDKIINFITKQL